MPIHYRVKFRHTHSYLIKKNDLLNINQRYEPTSMKI